MLFNATFNNISVISWRSVLLMEETGSTWRKIKLLQTDRHLVFYVRIFVINNQTHTPIKRELIIIIIMIMMPAQNNTSDILNNRRN